ncbi:sorting nexin-25-like [Aplochiton taeniatus]
MSGNSILLNIFDAILKPVMPILKKKVNSFLSTLNPTEAQIALHIDNLCEKHWTKGLLAPPTPPRSSDEVNETREQAQHLINRYSKYLILKKTDLERFFRLFQNKEENKKLVYMILSFLLRELLPDDDDLKAISQALQKSVQQ